MKKFALVATGGTFDIIHKGHLTLLSESFRLSSKVIIGLTSDEFAQKNGKSLQNDFDSRLIALDEILKKSFPNSSYVIRKLDDDFGPAVLTKDVEALVVSGETQNKGKILNELRQNQNLSPVKVIVVPMVMAQDGTRISTTRIKNSEIDKNGNLN